MPPHVFPNFKLTRHCLAAADVILTEEKAQHLYGEINFEYPVNLAVSVNGELASWGRFYPDSLPIERLAALAPKAQMIIDRVGW